ncbi:hypothetical protein HR17_01965 [Porphyromonas gulae]|uniref:hypothetical protein n=1 Tax=Porphyromonas TaxID=836 RepID=UPI00051D23D6|nr:MULTISPECIES: hypothetical protein [Porphyromonas]KGL55150.1 hypothetical protein HQ50_07335 [Porphyromonas sp. COT-052 OH4946]KGN76546.1 hypothetical protein HR17_01965 [Porphyromonas gulae]KGN87663.1 hypothetical protein HQ46_08580 [Porphyromonas gulae]
MRRGFRGKNKRAEAVLAGKLALILLVALILVVFFILKGLDWVAGEEGGFGVFSGLFVFWLSFAFAIVVYLVSRIFAADSVVSPVRQALLTFFSSAVVLSIVRVATMEEHSLFVVLGILLVLLLGKFVIKPILWLFS